MKKDFQFSKPAPAIMTGAGLLLIFILFYWNSIGNLTELWNSNETYSHGFLVFALIVYLLSLQNKPLKQLLLKPAPLFLIPLSLTIGLWLLAAITDTQTIELTLLPFIFIFTYLSIIGYKASYFLLATLAYIIVALPIWGILIPFFQSMAVAVNEFSLQLIGISTYIKDTTVTIPAGVFEIEGGCAGIRYLVVTLALGGFFSLLNFRHIRSAIILMAFSFIIPVIFNWIRIYSIILIGHFSNMESSLVEDHKGFGWVLYGFSLIPLFFVAQKIMQTENKTEVPHSHETIKTNTPYPIYYIVLPLILMLSAPAFISYLNNSKVDVLTDIETPKAEFPWTGPIYTNDWHPDYKGASIEINKLYVGTKDIHDISLHIYYYGTQSQDRELINELNNITKSRMIKSKQIIALEKYNITENIIIDHNNEKRAVWYWYFINNQNTIKPIVAKLLQSKELITGKIRSTLISVSTKCQSDCTDERSFLKKFLEKHDTNIFNSLKR